MEKTNVTTQCYKKVPLELSCQLRILHQQCRLGIAKLRKKFHSYAKNRYADMQKSQL